MRRDFNTDMAHLRATLSGEPHARAWETMESIKAMLRAHGRDPVMVEYVQRHLGRWMLSPERAQWIARIREDPDDDDLRLACADWFEAQGGPAGEARAHFIRLQIERARLSEDDPRVNSLLARELRLLSAWSDVWLGGHFVFKKCRFRRGFVEYVHLHQRQFLHHRRQMMALEPVRDVSLVGLNKANTRPNPELTRRVARCPEWRWVETLRLPARGCGNSIRAEDVLLLLSSPHMSRLKLLACRCVLSEDDHERLRQLPLGEQLTISPGEPWGDSLALGEEFSVLRGASTAFIRADQGEVVPTAPRGEMERIAMLTDLDIELAPLPVPEVHMVPWRRLRSLKCELNPSNQAALRQLQAEPFQGVVYIKVELVDRTNQERKLAPLTKQLAEIFAALPNLARLDVEAAPSPEGCVEILERSDIGWLNINTDPWCWPRRHRPYTVPPLDGFTAIPS